MKVIDHVYRSLGYRLLNMSTFFKANDSKKKSGDLELRVFSSDIRVFRQIFLDEVYNFFPEQFAPKTIVDAGANVGYSPVWFARKFPEATVYAVEPERKNFARLEKNIQGCHSIVPVRAGLWYKETFLKINDPGSGHWGFTTEEDQSATVPAITIPWLINKYQLQRIDLLKIDIEGSEFELFANDAQNWIPLVKLFMLETHDRIKPGCTAMIDAVLLPLGYQKFITKELSIYVATHI